MSLTGVEPLERVRRLVDSVAGLDVRRIDPIIGDASNRAYFRIVLADGDSRIVALVPEAFDPETLPFLNVSELFSRIPIRVPVVHHVAGEQGAIVLEDLGDNLLQAAVDGATLERKTELYQAAVDILITLQRRAGALANDRYIPFRIAFDREKFMWELNFFRKYFLEGVRGCDIHAPDREALDSQFEALTAELCSQEFVLCHRDYHARNLMVPDDGSTELVVIDFQDARQGPRVYDLVSLLNDSYVAHAPELVASMTERFERGIDADVTNEYDVAALQRNLKALGTFGYQIGQRDNVVYERYVMGTLSMVRTNLARNSRWDPLRRILARHCEEIG